MASYNDRHSVRLCCCDRLHILKCTLCSAVTWIHRGAQVPQISQPQAAAQPAEWCHLRWQRGECRPLWEPHRG